jgi:NADP-dependent 3-hydroxy acid dehydrogenase YdfG
MRPQINTAGARDGLNGRVVLVTGASSGIGQAIALALASSGAAVWIVSRSADELANTAAGAAPEADLRPLAADLTDDAEIARVRKAIEAGPGTLDAVIHAAGTISFGSAAEASVADLDAQYRINLRARFLLTQTVLPMLQANDGDLVFVSSTAALGPRPGVGQYAALQAALRAMADAIHEVNARGVHVLTIFPGRTATPMQEQIHQHEGRDYDPERLMQPQDVAALVVVALQLPRTAEVTEIVMRPFLPPS